jgi:DNA modification methylase
LGTNFPSAPLPFQGWHRFKEAYAPEIVERAIRESTIDVSSCLDPFAGSGTTGLACQFLGVHPVLAEVNPFLADLSEAKLTTYNTDGLSHDLGEVIRRSSDSVVNAGSFFCSAPRTFIEPGWRNRWIFDECVAERILAIRFAIESLESSNHARLFKVLLGGLLLEFSNVVVNGKGRRYRNNWQKRKLNPDAVLESFTASCRKAISEIHTFARRQTATFDVLRVDSRQGLSKIQPVDISVFSPPYPNSFDYTDVYNIELWALGYLQNYEDNRALRQATLSSHVQVSRDYAPEPAGSPILSAVLDSLRGKRSELWDTRIPEMVGGYFADLLQVLQQISEVLRPGGSVWTVVGDSRYGGIQVRTGEILSELASHRGWACSPVEPFRSMRASAQQGGMSILSEDLLILTKPG